MKDLDPNCKHWYPRDMSLREDLSDHEFTCFECFVCDGILKIKKETEGYEITRSFYDLGEIDTNFLNEFEKPDPNRIHQLLMDINP